MFFDERPRVCQGPRRHATPLPLSSENHTLPFSPPCFPDGGSQLAWRPANPPARTGLSDSHLSVLALRGNALTGPVPASLGDIQSLNVLNLAGNDLTGPVPASLGNTALGTVLLAHNELSGPIPPTLGNLELLTTLNMASNALTGAVPASLGNLPALREAQA